PLVSARLRPVHRVQKERHCGGATAQKVTHEARGASSRTHAPVAPGPRERNPSWVGRKTHGRARFRNARPRGPGRGALGSRPQSTTAKKTCSDPRASRRLPKKLVRTLGPVDDYLNFVRAARSSRLAIARTSPGQVTKNPRLF